MAFVLILTLGWVYLREYRLEYCVAKYPQSEDAASVGGLSDLSHLPRLPGFEEYGDRQRCLDKPISSFLF